MLLKIDMTHLYNFDCTENRSLLQFALLVLVQVMEDYSSPILGAEGKTLRQDLETILQTLEKRFEIIVDEEKEIAKKESCNDSLLDPCDLQRICYRLKHLCTKKKSSLFYDDSLFSHMLPSWRPFHTLNKKHHGTQLLVNGTQHVFDMLSFIDSFMSERPVSEIQCLLTIITTMKREVLILSYFWLQVIVNAQRDFEEVEEQWTFLNKNFPQ